MPLQLRPYQTEAADSFLEFIQQPDVNRGLAVFPTGCGKTIFGLSLAKRIGGRCLWLAHRKELINQPIEALKLVWPEAKPGIVKAERNEWARQFVFASVQTAWRPSRREKLKDFDLVVVDEAHHAAASSYQLILEAAGVFDPGGPPLLGLTATPERTDNLRLDEVFQGIVHHLQLRQAVESGYLCDVEMNRRGICLDLDAVGMSRGDFKVDELHTAMLEAGIVNDVGNAVDQLARDRKAIIFTVSVDQAHRIAAELQRRGMNATSISGETPDHIRNERLRGLHSGKYTHIVNCQVLTEGFDSPSVDCIVVARPTTSKSLYVQMVGRGLRLYPGKRNCLVIDMVGVSSRHTLIQAPAIFGLPANDDSDPRSNTAANEDGSERHRSRLLASQLQGVAPLARSALQWVEAKPGVYALSCGEGGNLLMRMVAPQLWRVEVVGRAAGGGRESLTLDPVGLELAQGVAEDYVRRASAVYLSNRSARWRDTPATERQVKALRRWKVDVPDGLTKGQASDLLTKCSANDWRNDPATPKQVQALRRRGETFDPATLTKGLAGRLLARGW